MTSPLIIAAMATMAAVFGLIMGVTRRGDFELSANFSIGARQLMISAFVAGIIVALAIATLITILMDDGIIYRCF